MAGLRLRAPADPRRPRLQPDGPLHDGRHGAVDEGGGAPGAGGRGVRRQCQARRAAGPRGRRNGEGARHGHQGPDSLRRPRAGQP